MKKIKVFQELVKKNEYNNKTFFYKIKLKIYNLLDNLKKLDTPKI